MRYQQDETIYRMSEEEYPDAVRLWEISVKATHLFLSSEDFKFYKIKLEEEYLKDLTLYGYRVGGRLAGFSGINGGKLALLFLHPTYFGMGIGKKLLLHALNEHNITIVDVNQQNTFAYEFYRHFGFEVISESPVDGCGKPYPMLCMAFRIERIPAQE